jgi:hypothetical protein
MADAHRLYRAAGFVERAWYPESEAPPELVPRLTYMTRDLTSAP